MNSAERFLKQKIDERIANGLLRKLTTDHSRIDFSSNDYVGLGQSTILEDIVALKLQELHHFRNGAGGSRLLTGNHAFTEETEKFIASFHHSEAGLIYNSGYDANIGLLSSLPQRGDTIITDELIHASLIDGARLSHATRYKFKHNDITDLEQKLKIAQGLIYVVIESVYSMDGDTAPIREINQLCQKYSANLIVDEAHATGVFGNHGRGLIAELGLEKEIFARIVTFGKAIGVHGAIILGSVDLRNFLINFSRSFIYTTAAPFHNIVSIYCAYEVLKANDFSSTIKQKIKLYCDLIEHSGLERIVSNSAIQTILFNNNENAKNTAGKLQELGFDVRAILSPTVPSGKERLRICLHTYNTDEQITDLVKHLKELI